MKDDERLQKVKSWMRKNFRSDWCGEWESTIHVVFERGEAMTVDVEGRALRLLAGRKGDPLSTIETNAASFLKTLKNETPLDIAVMRNELKTDNMAETFKFVSVFKPVRRKKKAPTFLEDAGGPSNAHRNPPALPGQKKARALLEKWCEAVSKDELIQDKTASAGVDADFYVNVPDCGAAINVQMSAAGLKPSLLDEFDGDADMTIDARTLHNILGGVQNLMISLNQKKLDSLIGERLDERALELLLFLHPALSRVYRELPPDESRAG